MNVTTGAEQSSAAEPRAVPSAQSVRAEDDEGLDRLRSPEFRTPCLSASVLPGSSSAAGLSDSDFSNRVEVRLRAAGLRPVPWDRERCPLPAHDGPRTVTGPALTTVALGVTTYLDTAGTFSIELTTYRVVEWRVVQGTPDDDGRRAALLEVDSDREPSFNIALRRTPDLRHEGRPAPILEAVDRMLDRFLVRYLRANQ
jgi:hypothetical protein